MQPWPFCLDGCWPSSAEDDISLGITAVGTAGLFGATVLLAWRVPESADSLGRQLSQATEQLSDVQAHRDALIEVLSREPLYAEAIPQGQGGRIKASEPMMGGRVAPLLIVDMPPRTAASENQSP